MRELLVGAMAGGTALAPGRRASLAAPAAARRHCARTLLALPFAATGRRPRACLATRIAGRSSSKTPTAAAAAAASSTAAAAAEPGTDAATGAAGTQPRQLPGEEDPVLAPDPAYRDPAPLPPPPTSATAPQVCGCLPLGAETLLFAEACLAPAWPGVAGALKFSVV